MTRTALGRVRAYAGIATFALRQLEDELGVDTLDRPQLSDMLRELHHGTGPQASLVGQFAQLLAVAARQAERLEPDRDGDVSCPLREAAALVSDNVGQRIHWATRALDLEGERA